MVERSLKYLHIKMEMPLLLHGMKMARWHQKGSVKITLTEKSG